MGKKVDKNKLEYGNHPPEWITSKEIAYIEEIGEIIRFFVVNSPCKGISARGMTFEEYGWSSKQLKNDGCLHKRLFEIANLSENETFFSCEKKQKCEETFIHNIKKTESQFWRTVGQFVQYLKQSEILLHIVGLS